VVYNLGVASVWVKVGVVPLLVCSPLFGVSIRPQPPYSNQQIGLTLETPRKTLYSGNTQHSYHQSNREHGRWKYELGTRRHVTVKDRQQHKAYILRNTSINQNGTSQ
jgi:hypothetical protein